MTQADALESAKLVSVRLRLHADTDLAIPRASAWFVKSLRCGALLGGAELNRCWNRVRRHIFLHQLISPRRQCLALYHGCDPGVALAGLLARGPWKKNTLAGGILPASIEEKETH
eukprot:783171-Pelagomonas_calceolata.AAC.1